MSYILDALNKSDRQRTRNRIPGLQDNPDEPPESGWNIRHFLLVLVLLAAANSIGVYLYFGERSAPAETTGVREDITPPLEGIPRDDSADQPTTIPPPVATAGSGATSVPVPISSLPAELQVRLPEVSVTSHIYSEDAAFRNVKINGDTRHEGDLIGARHRLLAVTESGVILEFEGYAYILDIVEDWQL